MALANYKTKDNVQWQFLVWVNSIETSFVVKTWQGSRYPSEYPYICTAEKVDSEDVVIWREKVLVTNRSWDTMTVTRWFDWDTPLDFSADDYFSLYVTSAIPKDQYDELERLEEHKLDIETYNNTWRNNLTPNSIIYVNDDWDEEMTTLWNAWNYLKSNWDWNAPSFSQITALPRFFGDWSDWELDLVSWTTNLNPWQLYNYSEISIASWANLWLASDWILFIRCNGNCHIDGTINVTGKKWEAINTFFEKINLSVWNKWSWWNGWDSWNADGWAWWDWYGWWGAWWDYASQYWWNGGDWWTPWWVWGTGATSWWAGWISAWWWGWWDGAWWNAWAGWNGGDAYWNNGIWGWARRWGWGWAGGMPW